MIFLAAMEADFDEIVKLYQNAVGSEGCTWDENYPSMEHIRADFLRGDLFCLKAENGEIAGVIAIDDDTMVNELSCWSQGGAELSRLVVKGSYQNRQLAGELLLNAMQELKKRGFSYVHFLVSKAHKRALRAYNRLNFDVVGESDLYDGDWFCYEKKL